MPHTILEYTASVADAPDLQAFWTRLHRFLVAAAPCREQDLKSRAYRLEDFRMGDGRPGLAYAHLTIQLMEGRTPEVLARIGQGALDLLGQTFPRTLAERQADLTVEIRPMRQDSYFKATSVQA